MPRVLAIGLDGMDLALVEKLIGQGRLPHLSRLRERGIGIRLDHGRDKLSGLAWEQVATGLAPSDGGRWSAVRYDPCTYEVIQEDATTETYLDKIAGKVVAFDLPYCRLSDNGIQGLAAWGAHDPGVEAHSNPPGLAAEIEQRFGPYPAPEWIYGSCWPSPERTEAASKALIAAVDKRCEIALWLLRERIPDWDLAIVVPSEAHSGSEPLWHGVDASHPLNAVASAKAAGEGLVGIYDALDRLVGQLAEAFPDATVLAFSMHGMGKNEGDVPAMALLPELLYRRSFGKPYMRQLEATSYLADGTPLFSEQGNWDATLRKLVRWPDAPGRLGKLLIKAGLGRTRDLDALRRHREPRGIGWMPATRYRSFWPRMDAFALPAFYDGQIRINLRGREASGTVEPERYDALLGELEQMLAECRDPLSGEPAVSETFRASKPPAKIGPYEADLYVLFRSGLLGIEHRSTGAIGPLPWRRTGGHTGDWGFLFGTGPGLKYVTTDSASSFDVVPTMLDLLGDNPALARSGRSLVKAAG
ncbi:hypothetical protein [Aminobacter sp. HY435]|uniref:hypothetical protein n=1 Tax=Aminobacter sp. HY435 TaxID=2970917 RepID=UPI0022B9A517|nr:hypothetical protein [Aminobacter sp. HY435]